MDAREERIAKLLGSPELFSAKTVHESIIAQTLWSERRVTVLVGSVAIIITLLSILTLIL